jgi:cyclopropane-fatty-acyl-phospholipid synthase
VPRRGFEVERELAFGADYAETLRRWRLAFLAREAEVRALGFDTRFMKIWEFYLAYCEAAFASGNTDVVQFTLRKPA